MKSSALPFDACTEFMAPTGLNGAAKSNYVTYEAQEREREREEPLLLLFLLFLRFPLFVLVELEFTRGGQIMSVQPPPIIFLPSSNRKRHENCFPPGRDELFWSLA